MKILPIINPVALERRTQQALLDAPYARFLDHVLISARTVKRGPGQCRPNFAGEETTSVAGATVFNLSGGVKLLVWSTTGGAWKAQAAPAAANRPEDY